MKLGAGLKVSKNGDSKSLSIILLNLFIVQNLLQYLGYLSKSDVRLSINKIFFPVCPLMGAWYQLHSTLMTC